MAKISEAYKQAAIEGMSLNITDDEMFVLIPSERGNNAYRLWMDEQTMQPTSCNCAGFSRWQHCKHCTIVAEAFAGYVAPVEAPATTPVVESPAQEEKPKVTEIEAGNWYVVNSDTQVWLQDGEWIAVGPTANAIELVESHLEKQKAVAEAEQIVAQPVVAQQEDKLPAQEIVSLDDKRHERDILDAPLTRNSGFSLLRVS